MDINAMWITSQLPTNDAVISFNKNFIVEKTELAPDMKVTATYVKGGKETLTFTRTAATKYQYSLDGRDIGRVTSASYNKMLKYLKMAAADEKIEEQ